MSTLSPLPPEIVLQVLDYLPISAITSLERCSRQWKKFIDDEAARIWSQHVPSTTPWPLSDVPRGSLEGSWQDLLKLRKRDTFDRALYDVKSWRDLCKQRHRLLHNWRGRLITESPSETCIERPPSPQNRWSRSARKSSSSFSNGLAFWRTDPRTRRIREGLAWSALSDTGSSSTTDSYHSRATADADGLPMKYRLPQIKQSAYDIPEGRLIWRFRPDFERRLILTTGQQGGMLVLDMDDGRSLWSVPNVIPFAHLEFNKGHAVWNDDNEGLEIWRCTNERGVFEHVHTLRHTYQLRGFHLVYPTLCVVANDGRAFVYNISQEPRHMLQRDFPIEMEARGHLYQHQDVVTINYEKKGYHFFEKATGSPLGILHPTKLCSDLPQSRVRHIKHDLPTVRGVPQHFVNYGPHETYAKRIEEALHDSLRTRTHPETVPLGHGWLENVTQSPYRTLGEDEWGAPVLWINWMVCISRAGRVMLCSDWRGALKDAERAKACTTMIECMKTGEDFRFDFGGWLSVAHGRVLWEIDDWIYILHLPLAPDEKLGDVPIWCIPGVADASFRNPISFMGMYEDCLMTTYTSIRAPVQQGQNGGPWLAHTKTIRIASFVPPNEGLEIDQDMHSLRTTESGLIPLE